MSKICLMIIFLSTLMLNISCSNRLNVSSEKNSIKPLPPLTESELKVLKYMGGKVLQDGNIAIGKVQISRVTNEISFPGNVEIREGDLEVLISTPTGRIHEALIVSKIDPYNLQLALFLIGAHNGTLYPPNSEKFKDGKKKSTLPQGSLLDILIELQNGKRVPIEHWLLNKGRKKEKFNTGWVFVGSNFDVAKKCLATEEGNIVNLWNFGNSILGNPTPSGVTDDYFVSFTKNIPEKANNIKVIMKVK